MSKSFTNLCKNTGQTTVNTLTKHHQTICRHRGHRAVRDIFGKPLALTRTDTATGNAITRSYVYDTHQRLCKRVEPETGATLMQYDGANNIDWTVTGSTLTAIDTPAQCETDRNNVVLADKTVRTYDTLNRPLTVAIAHTPNDLAYSYYADGALQTLTSGSGTTANVWSYTYDMRRLPVTEQLSIDGRVETDTSGTDHG